MEVNFVIILEFTVAEIKCGLVSNTFADDPQMKLTIINHMLIDQLHTEFHFELLLPWI